MLQTNNLKGVSDSLPSTVKMATKEPPICDLEKIVGKNQIVRYVEFELVKLSQLVSVGGNLNNSQVQFIASQLVDLFPRESIADFKICFERGCIGQYGEIFRMDGIVLRKWMEQYLEEKYQVIEDELVKEKENIYERPVICQDEKVDKYINEMLENLKPTEKVRDITPKEMQEEGREKPKAYKHPSTPKSIIVEKLLHDEWIKQNHDVYTGKPLPNWMPEEEWLKQLEG